MAISLWMSHFQHDVHNYHVLNDHYRRLQDSYVKPPVHQQPARGRYHVPCQIPQELYYNTANIHQLRREYDDIIYGFITIWEGLLPPNVNEFN